MKWLSAAVLFTGLVGAVAAQDPGQELKRLEGTYKVKAISEGGTDAPAEVIDAIKGVVIKGDRFVITVADEDMPARIKIDPTRTPAHIDISPESGPEREKTFPGVYKLEKADLIIVITKGGERPRDFKADGEKDMKLVLTRKERDK